MKIEEEYPDLPAAVIEEIHALRITVEEGGELIAEAHRAISGLAEESLRPCNHLCAGHLREKGRLLYARGLKAYEGLRT